MAWTLFEELLKICFGCLVGLLLKGITGVWRMTEKCVIEKCTRSRAAGSKGLCLVCYSKAKKLVSSKKVTWEELAEKGLCKLDVDPFDDAYSKAMEE